MMVLNDIWLISYLKGLGDVFKDNEIEISNLFLGGYALKYHEKQFIRSLNEQGKLGVFDTDLGFSNILSEASNLISHANAASIYYAEKNNMPIITKHKIISAICKRRNIVVYKPLSALKILNIGNDKINFIEKILGSEIEKI